MLAHKGPWTNKFHIVLPGAGEHFKSNFDSRQHQTKWQEGDQEKESIQTDEEAKRHKL